MIFIIHVINYNNLDHNIYNLFYIMKKKYNIL
jgi:hypothetical protein